MSTKRIIYLTCVAALFAAIILINIGFLLLLLALLPSIVAYYVDGHPKKLVFKVVLSGNVSAALPVIVPLMKSSSHMGKIDISSAMIDPKIWMFTYMGAGAGWALIYLCKFVARFVVAMSFEFNIRTLENAQKTLIEEWGNEVSQFNDKPSAEETKKI